MLGWHVPACAAAAIVPPASALKSGSEIQSAPQPPRAPDLDYYLGLEDGERVAVSVWLPTGRAPEVRVPVLLYQTRYGRQSANAGKNMALLPAHPYAVAFVDVRGTTASSGKRLLEINQEAGDMRRIVHHLASQAWCSGQVVAIGQSYLADTADTATGQRAPELRAAVVRQSDFDVFTHSMQPGGVQNLWALREYDRWTLPMDTGQGTQNGRALDCVLRAEDCAAFRPTLMPVRGDTGLSLLRKALVGRTRWRAADFDAVRFRDQPSHNGYSLFDWSPSRHIAAMRQQRVPVQYWGSWMDAGTAEAALARFRSAPEIATEVWITANDHDGRRLSDPLQPQRTTPVPAWDVQQRTMLRFVRDAVAGTPPRRVIHYYVLGSGEFQTSPAWPPPRIEDWILYLTPEGRLSTRQPVQMSAAYNVDFSVSAGKKTRWSANLGIPADYGDRASAAMQSLTFLSKPVTSDMELAGYPRLRLRLSSRTTDPAVHVFLDDVAPDGRVSYLTEGMLRLLHRKVVPAERLPFDQGPDAHSYSRDDAEPMPAGRFVEVEIRLFPVAALLRRGHAVRVSIAGADADTFARYSEGREEVLTVSYGSRATSIALPLRPWRQMPGSEANQ
jgi:putative CocE/NonD family hydrolase